MTKEEMQKLIDLSANLTRNLKDAVEDALMKIGHAVEFDWENEGAPSLSSCQFDDDLTDACITKIWFEEGLIKVNLHAYYLGDDRENISLDDECDVDYADILSNLIEEIPE